MANITFHNVQHGEYISIDMPTCENRDLTIIRDFGSYPASSTALLKMQSKILIESKKNMDAILSHAHKDHCNGFVSMYECCPKQNGKIIAPPFHRAYIPYLRYSDAKELGALILKVGVYLLYLLPRKSYKRYRISNWMKMTPIMYDLSEHLIGVEEGFIFPDWSQKGTVLWPPQPDSVYYENLIQELELQTEQLREYLPQGVGNDPDIVYEQLRVAMDYVERDDKQNFQTTALDHINSILTSYLANNETMQVSKEGKKAIAEVYKKYQDTIDNHSIVFSIDAKESSNGILFLSDLDEVTMDLMFQSVANMKTSYKIIKSAHHGSRLGTIFQANVKATEVVHCCGKGSSRFFGPDVRYQNMAPNIICSDWVYSNKKWRRLPSYKFFYANIYSINV